MTSNSSRSVYAGLLVATVLGSVVPTGGEPPPIQLIYDLHMDPLHGIPLSLRPQVYAAWRDAAEWALDECEPRGAKITFLSVGEYMEYALDDPAHWVLIQRLANSGGSIGTHSHWEKKFGPHDWRDLPPNAPMPQIIQLWHDHIVAVNAVLTAALGVTDPNELREINNTRGTHAPANDAARLDLMEQFGFTMHQQGPDEEFFVYFQHHPMNPYRPSGESFLVHDPAGPVVDSPFGPVLGHNEVHFGIPQDMRLPALQARFLLTLLNWLDDLFVAQTDRVWDFGWATHGADIVPGQPSRAALVPMLDWLKENFTDAPVSGRTPLQFSSARQTRDLYYAWETAHPGQVPFSYAPAATDWALYPYLMPVAKYLVGAQYDNAMSVNSVRLHRVIASTAIGGPYELYVAYPAGPEPVQVDLSSVIGPGVAGVVDPRTGLAPVFTTAAILVPPTGRLIVPVESRLALPNGDLNLDGYCDFDDVNPFVAVLTGQDADPDHRMSADINRDGNVDFFDINWFIGLLTR